ncbi:hypothetical protein PsYK624_172540 [Phanerochaete sordida]|uniref:Uncharacterized protein n=1 Tax=Phanerochaete sordida TaxID=48140 RepID=A0A9P3GVA1_9APHY|nr:hypothetical protein PsYK624_172540 [Phanerochaete sordida]
MSEAPRMGNASRLPMSRTGHAIPNGRMAGASRQEAAQDEFRTPPIPRTRPQTPETWSSSLLSQMSSPLSQMQDVEYNGEMAVDPPGWAASMQIQLNEIVTNQGLIWSTLQNMCGAIERSETNLSDRLDAVLSASQTRPQVQAPPPENPNDYPDVHFWVKDSWEDLFSGKHGDSAPSASELLREPAGKTLIAKKLRWLQDENGDLVTPERYRLITRAARGRFTTWIKNKVAPLNFETDISAELREEFCLYMETESPELALCADHWKAIKLGIYIYPTFKRSRKAYYGPLAALMGKDQDDIVNKEDEEDEEDDDDGEDRGTQSHNEQAPQSRSSVPPRKKAVPQTAPSRKRPAPASDDAQKSRKASKTAGPSPSSSSPPEIDSASTEPASVQRSGPGRSEAAPRQVADATPSARPYTSPSVSSSSLLRSPSSAPGSSPEHQVSSPSSGLGHAPTISASAPGRPGLSSVSDALPDRDLTLAAPSASASSFPPRAAPPSSAGRSPLDALPSPLVALSTRLQTDLGDFSNLGNTPSDAGGQPGATSSSGMSNGTPSSPHADTLQEKELTGLEPRQETPPPPEGNAGGASATNGQQPRTRGKIYQPGPMNTLKNIFGREWKSQNQDGTDAAFRREYKAFEDDEARKTAYIEQLQNKGVKIVRAPGPSRRPAA